MLDVGWLGSPVDVATFVVVVATLLYELRPTQELLSAAVVALAEQLPDVDHQQLQSRLDVEDRDVDALRPTLVDSAEVRR